jgi:hypothetical protein
VTASRETSPSPARQLAGEVVGSAAYRVRVTERVSEPLAGVGDCRYDSPPQSRADALVLVRVLLGTTPDLTRSRWERPIAGGQRSIELVDVQR